MRLVDDVEVIDLVLPRTQLLEHGHIFARAPYCIYRHFKLIGLVEELWKLGEWEAISQESLLDGLLRACKLCFEGFAEKWRVLGDVLQCPDVKSVQASHVLKMLDAYFSAMRSIEAWS